MIQISKERLYEMALESINVEAYNIYNVIDKDEFDRRVIDALATIGGITSFALKVVKEGDVKENE